MYVCKNPLFMGLSSVSVSRVYAGRVGFLNIKYSMTYFANYRACQPTSAWSDLPYDIYVYTLRKYANIVDTRLRQYMLIGQQNTVVYRVFINRCAIMQAGMSTYARIRVIFHVIFLRCVYRLAIPQA